jgi:hypothetical protein
VIAPVCGTYVARAEDAHGRGPAGGQPTRGLTWGFGVERAKGIEPL